MSLDRTDHIIYGWKLPKEIEGFDYWDEKNLPYVEGHVGEKYRIIRGEGHNYTIFGIVIAESYEWNFVNIDLSKIDLVEINNKYKDIFGGTPNESPSLFIFSNYS
jgi:hypothetical protein